MVAPGIGAVALRGKGINADETPDEDRIVRGDKQGRVAKVMPVAPPKAFNAGSVFKRTSMLLHSTLDKKMEMAFAAPQIKGKEIQIAAAFHTREDPKPDPLLPPVLAALVNNDKARRAGDRLRTGQAGLCRRLAVRDAAQGWHRR